MSLWCLDHLFSYQIDMIMPHLHYSENGVITSCIPTVKCAENKLVSAVIVSCINAKERIPKATVRFFLEFSLEAKDE